MILLALAIIVVGTYAPLMHAAAGGNRIARALGVLEGVAFVAGTGLASLLALYLFGARCDESCWDDVPQAPYEWWHTLDAWQWDVQFALAVTALAAAVATVVLPLVRRHAAAVAAAVFGLAVFCAWALIVAPLGDQFGI